MERKDKIDTFGAVSLVLFSTLLAFNHVVIKVVNSGLQPVFSAGVRSVGASIILFLAFRFLGRRMKVPKGSWPGILLISVFFSVEFIFLFVALDLTTVGRTSVIFYSMPVWMAIGAHFWLGEKLTSIKVVGLVLAMLGVAWAILDRPTIGEASLIGDLCALAGAVLWAGIGLGAGQVQKHRRLARRNSLQHFDTRRLPQSLCTGRTDRAA